MKLDNRSENAAELHLHEEGASRLQQLVDLLVPFFGDREKRGSYRQRGRRARGSQSHEVSQLVDLLSRDALTSTRIVDDESGAR